MRPFSWKLLSAASVLAFPLPAFAQVASEPAAPQAAVGLEEIIVTARRQTESLLDVPVAVTAISSDAIERARVNDLSDIAQLAPNVMIAPTNNGAAVSVRGVGTGGFDPGQDQSVGISIDGVSIGRSKIVMTSQFDIQQVEILKGPQALFFGKNSPAGVVSITTADPTREFSAMARAGYEFDADERYAEAFVSGPISETLLFRLAGRYSNMDGWQKNNAMAGPNLAFPGFPSPPSTFSRSPTDETIAGRATLKWEPNSAFSATAKFTASKLEGITDGANELYCGDPNGKPSILSLGINTVVTDPNADCRLDGNVTVGSVPRAFLAGWDSAQKKDGAYWYELQTYLGSLTLNYDISDNLSLTSVTGYTKLKSAGFNNIDRTSFAVIVSAPEENARSWSQELRLVSAYDGPLNFTIGAFFEDTKRSNVFEPYLGFAGFDPNNNGSMYTFTNLWRTEGKTYSGFGQVRWNIFEQLELAGGVRYTREKKDTSGVNTYLNALGGAFGLAPVGQVVSAKNEFSNWSPEATLSYKPSPGVLIYAAYKTGYKSGGLSTPATISTAYVANPSLLSFRPERSKGFEAGIKGELFNRTVRAELVAYRYTFTDLQLTTFNPQLVAYFVNNAGKSRTSGVEASATWRATPELTLNASASYTDAKFLDFQGAQCYTDIQFTPLCPGGPADSYDRSGQPLPRAPDWTFTGGFNYEREFGDGLKVGIGGDAVYNSSFWTSELGNPAGIVDGFWRINASLRIGAADDKWELALLGRNLTDEYYPLVTSDATLAPAGNYGAYVLRPRQLAIQGTVRF